MANLTRLRQRVRRRKNSLVASMMRLGPLVNQRILRLLRNLPLLLQQRLLHCLLIQVLLQNWPGFLYQLLRCNQRRRLSQLRSRNLNHQLVRRLSFQLQVHPYSISLRNRLPKYHQLSWLLRDRDLSLRCRHIRRIQSSHHRHREQHPHHKTNMLSSLRLYSRN